MDADPVVRHVPIGMLYNDGGLAGAPADESQTGARGDPLLDAGTILDPVRGMPGAGGGNVGETKGQRLVSAAVAMLSENPAIEARAIARRLEVSVGWFARVFKAEMGMSLVEYRNRLRLDRVDAQVSM